jgi:hypothetical protein
MARERRDVRSTSIPISASAAARLGQRFLTAPDA